MSFSEPRGVIGVRDVTHVLVWFGSQLQECVVSGRCYRMISERQIDYTRILDGGHV